MSELILVIGSKNYSSWSLRPWLVLEHFQIPFREIGLDLGNSWSKKEILAHSPSGKVPVLKNGGLIVWESLAIIEYLADLFPQKNIWPKDLSARAVARAVSSEMHAGFMNLRKACRMNIKASHPQAQLSPEVIMDAERIKAVWTDCRLRFGKSGAFLFGEFSAADAMYAPVIWRFNTYGFKLEGILQKYFESMLQLPAMQTWRVQALKDTHVIP